MLRYIPSCICALVMFFVIPCARLSRTPYLSGTLDTSLRPGGGVYGGVWAPNFGGVVTLHVFIHKVIREKYRIMDQSSVDREVCRLSPTRQGPDLTSTLRGCDLGRRLRHRRDLRGVRLTGTTVEYYPYSTKVKKNKKSFFSLFPSIQLGKLVQCNFLPQTF